MMFKVTWTALMPETEMDFARRALAAEFNHHFDTEWHEEEISYKIVDDQHFNVRDVYDPIIRGTFSFNAVSADEEFVEGLCLHFKTMLHRLGITDIGFEYRP